MDTELVKVISAVTVLAFYVPFLVVTTKGLNAKRGRRHFYRSVRNILVRENDDAKVIEQLSIVYRRVSESNGEFSKKYRTPIDICEDLLARATGFTAWSFKFHYGLKFSDEELNRIAAIVKSIETELPFISLSPKYGNQLDMIRLAFESKDSTLGNRTLSQLAKDIKFLEATNENQERKNRISTWISVIGVVLTILFGAVSIVQIYTGNPSF
ncbi:hypothetical protein C4G29_RS22185 [Vibrio parahaemolyticus]|nr:hypothetical protein [Vibrio parahaemolyticus]ELB2177768.1 hypothetical protein [Vibrio parahaemolyticus]MBM4819275.1 hypothetical protein [Vibrio parahaemolyticus]